MFSKAMASRIVHRIGMCLIAVGLLWMTSLQTAVTIVQRFVDLPVLQGVKDTCLYSYDKTLDQSSSYSSCVTQQLDSCNTALEAALAEEQSRVERVQVKQQAILHFLEQWMGNCSMALSNAKRALVGYANTQTTTQVPYYSSSSSSNNNNSTCSASQLVRARAYLGDTSSSRSSAASTSNDYSIQSELVVDHLAAYTQVLLDYNARYLQNKTINAQLIVRQVTNQVSSANLPSINASFAQAQAQMNSLVACIGLGNGTSSSSSSSSSTVCPSGKGARALYDETRTWINGQQVAVKAIFALYASDLKSFQADLASKLKIANSFYDAIQGSAGVIQFITTNFGGIGLADLCKQGSINWCTISKNDWYINGISAPQLPTLQPMPSASVIWNQVKGALQTSQKGLSLDSLDVSAKAAKMVQSLEAALASTNLVPIHDYDPPRYPYATNTSDEAQKHQEQSISYRQGMASSLGQLGNASSSSSSSLANAQKGAMNASTNAAGQILSEFHVSWSSFSISGLMLDEWMASLLTLQGLLYLFDYAYRGLQTVKTIRKYWSNSVGTLPAVDLRVKGSEQSSSLSYTQIFLEALPYVWLQLLLIITFLVLASWSLATIYLQSYSNYSAMCVQASSNSTFLSRSLESLAYNYAALDGNSKVSVGIGAYNTRASGPCAGKEAESQQVFDSHLSNIKNTNNSFLADSNNMALLNDCVDAHSLDAYFGAACCGLQGYSACTSSQQGQGTCPMDKSAQQLPLLPPSAYLAASSCRAQTWPLLPPSSSDKAKNGTGDSSSRISSITATANAQLLEAATSTSSIYQCASLPMCVITCEGLDAQTIAMASQECSCVVEWYFHAHVFQGLVAVCVYILINASRALVFKGILIVYWKELNSPIFECKISCSQQGALLAEDGSYLLEEANKDKQQDMSSYTNNQASIIAQQLDANLLFYRHKGRVCIILGLLINGPWIVVLPYLNQQLTYKQHVV